MSMWIPYGRSAECAAAAHPDCNETGAKTPPTSWSHANAAGLVTSPGSLHDVCTHHSDLATLGPFARNPQCRSRWRLGLLRRERDSAGLSAPTCKVRARPCRCAQSRFDSCSCKNRSTLFLDLSDHLGPLLRFHLSFGDPPVASASQQQERRWCAGGAVRRNKGGHQRSQSQCSCACCLLARFQMSYMALRETLRLTHTHARTHSAVGSVDA